MKILLLDDDNQVLEFITDILSQTDIESPEILFFSSYDKALQTLMEQDIDCSLIDQQLHDSQNRMGIDFIQEATQQLPYHPFIMLTGTTGNRVMIKALESGAVDFIQKTMLRPALLEKTIRYTMRRSRELQQLMGLYEQLDLLNQMKTDTIRLAAHDIKTPLSTISLSLEVLRQKIKRQEPSEELLNQIDMIASANKTVNNIVEDVLSLEYIEEMKSESRKEVDLVLLVQSILNEFEPQYQEKNQNLTFTPTEYPTLVLGHAGQLREVISNLMSNAIKYTQSEGNIKITIEKNSKHTSLKVQDSGFGIPSAEHDQLFKPFSRIQMPETSGIQGTGLGLYLVKRMIDLHNGSIIFESVYGVGSTFGFSIPTKVSVG